MKKDIQGREDIILLVNTFYTYVEQSPTIGYIFNEVAKIDWNKHLPKMYSFWASALFGEKSYTGSPMRRHIALSKLTTMSVVEFNEWLSIFNRTVDELFLGKVANEAKFRAANIARNMSKKIQASGEDIQA